MANGVCANVRVSVQGHAFAVDLNVLPLGGCELVFGTQWLNPMGF